MYGSYSSSTWQKLTLSVLHLFIIAISYWLLFMNGIDEISKLFGFPIQLGDINRRILIISFGLLYFVRINITEYIFIKRNMNWSESLTISLWLFIVYMTFSLTGGTNSTSIGRTEYVAIALYLIGSLFNSLSELSRYRWKKKPENHGHLYTGGLFKFSRHINYFGDTLLFVGFAMITRSVWAYIIPASLLVLFTFVNIPMLDRYLRNHYGYEFEEYSHQTKKFIPFVY